MLASEVLADISGISLSPQMSKSIFIVTNQIPHCLSPIFLPLSGFLLYRFLSLEENPILEKFQSEISFTAQKLIGNSPGHEYN
jgi:hypothetical protein